MSTSPPPAAILASPDSAAAQRQLIDFAKKLMAAGVRVQGLVQETRREAGEKTAMELVEIDTGRRFSIKQNLGRSASCQVDTQGVAEASQTLRRALEQRAQLAVVNKFSHLEAQGQGLSAEMLALMAEGIPLLTTVSPDYLAAWNAFTGGMAVVLEANEPALNGWWTRSSDLPGC